MTVGCHGPPGCQLCPKPPIFPVAEYWIDWTSPMAFWAFWIAVFASCARATPDVSAPITATFIQACLGITPPRSPLRENFCPGLYVVRRHFYRSKTETSRDGGTVSRELARLDQLEGREKVSDFE